MNGRGCGHIQGQQCIRHRGDLVPGLEAERKQGRRSFDICWPRESDVGLCPFDNLPGITLATVQEVTRLANGNTIINNWPGSVPEQDWPTVVQLIEVTHDKKVVWALRDRTTLGPASSTQLLDQPGSTERRELQR
jgi:hypothetical protein